MIALRQRLPDMSEATLSEMLSWPLASLRKAIDHVQPLTQKSMDVLMEMTDADTRELMACAPEYFGSAAEQVPA
jgi:hypothetical protein